MTFEAGKITVQAHEHQYVDVVTPPACTEQGYTTHTCSICGDSYVDSYVDALGHDYEAVVTEPTCTTGGYTTYTCSRCDLTKTEPVAALGHLAGEPVQENVAPASFTKEGSRDVVTYCIRCGEELSRVQEAIPRLEPSEVLTDMPAKGHWAYDSIFWALRKGITNGTSPSTFSLNQACTRAQIVTFLWRAKGEPDPKFPDCPFADVPQSAYYREAVLWAYHEGITSGTSDTGFSPNQPCTRAQVVTFLWRAAGSPEPEATENCFLDVKANSYYVKAVLWAVKNEITKGTSVDAFSPNTVCSRAQVVTFLYRAREEKEPT
ncbi:MAG: S-layer homology domain-containing protein [Oscillospiraceae bacterium]|nr:S-layer homology domain-containing protein [Oscillospiraceae bacterium]